ncbi:mannose-6-phosphate isomerase, class I [Aeromonas caviae]|uniref:mannose-6-phosphate isomerase, class I n=1 Tax=Aeromonas caviae TaxID=648 RepID=UPI002B4824FC|nr:mannose-6-phosphate isomerase, class I [Aeromonas caviae]
MRNPIQEYDWGSRDALTRLFGITNPERKPQAELWMGAHPNGCSQVEVAGLPTPLSELIAGRGVAILGESTYARFGGLPFLFKVLCAEKALSIQVHPSKAQAEAGFAREVAEGIAIDAPYRNYRDDNHKPELVFALTPYQAMNGFRDFAAILVLFERVAAASLAPLVEVFAADQSEGGLARFFRALLTLEGESKETALAALRVCAERDRQDETFALVLDLFTQYPGDVGLFAPLLLNVVTLHPGQAMYLDAGTPPCLCPWDRARNHGQLRQRAAGRADRQASGRGRTARLHQMPAQAGRDAPDLSPCGGRGATLRCACPRLHLQCLRRGGTQAGHDERGDPVCHQWLPLPAP